MKAHKTHKTQDGHGRDSAWQPEHLGWLMTLLASAIALGLLVAHQAVIGLHSLEEEMQTQLAVVSTHSTAPLVFGDRSAALDTIQSFERSEKIVAAALYQANGNLLADYIDTGVSIRFPEQLVASADHAPPAALLAQKSLEYALLFEPVRWRDEQVGYLALYYSYANFYRVLLEFIVGGLVIVGLALLVTRRLTQRLRWRVKRAKQQLETQAFVDPVTRLPNRRYFEQELRRAVQSLRHFPRGVALLFIDLDDFKNINDLHGHAVGDRALRLTAERIRSKLRASDLVARVGGDEFAALLFDIGGAEGAARLAGELLATIGTSMHIDEINCHVGLSIGIALLPDDGQDAETLWRRADQAMYVAKSKGKNGFHFFSSDIDQRMQRRLLLEDGLREALQHGQGLWLAYQPQFCAQSRRCVGLEVLVRWQTAAGEAVSPAEFIPILERSNQIGALGEWVLRQACADICALQARGLVVPRVAVNVSPRQLLRGLGVLDNILDIIGHSQLTVAQFELELTEGALMDERGRAVLDAFRYAGFDLAIDDFGTGYSSLAYLRTFHVACLKIDKSFIQRLPGKPEDEAIVKAIIQMATAMQLRVVAEGVETEAQAEFLATHRCQILQGFLLARPMPLAELETFLLNEQNPT